MPGVVERGSWPPELMGVRGRQTPSPQDRRRGELISKMANQRTKRDVSRWQKAWRKWLLPAFGH